MEHQNTKTIKLLFFIILILELIGELLAQSKSSFTLVYIVKPLLMPFLMAYYYKSIKVVKGKSNLIHRFVLVALFFSFLGDVFLMFTWSGANLFLFGLGAFLLAHVSYVFAFTKGLNQSKPSIIKRKRYSIFPIVGYAVLLVWLLFKIGNSSFFEMKLPVIIYAAVIMVMVMTALNRYESVAFNSFKYVFLGAILFMLSDSIIALNKFTALFEDSRILARILIMSMYGLGQYFIVEGMILQSKTNQD